MPLDDDDVYSQAIMRVLPAVPDPPLDAPPAEGFDLVDVQICPSCGSPDAAVQQVEDAEIAKCPQCQCEFSPRIESVTRTVIRRISEHRERRLQRVMERMPLQPAPVLDSAPFHKPKVYEEQTD